MPKQYVTLEGKRVAVSEITSKEKPFPFSTNFHDQGTSIMWNDISHYESDIKAFENMKQDDYTEKNIKELTEKISARKKEILHRHDMCEEHNLRFGADTS